MVTTPCVPSRGDVVWVNLNPTKGHEQKGSRPAFVISPHSYNERAGMMLACPITSKIKGYPFEVRLFLRDCDGVVLTDQIRSIDWKIRNISLIGHCDQEIIEEVQNKLMMLINE